MNAAARSFPHNEFDKLVRALLITRFLPVCGLALRNVWSKVRRNSQGVAAEIYEFSGDENVLASNVVRFVLVIMVGVRKLLEVTCRSRG